MTGLPENHSAVGTPTPPVSPIRHKFLRKWFGRGQSGAGREDGQPGGESDSELQPARTPIFRRLSQKVVPQLPRAQTFKRQLSEQRQHLAPVEPSIAEKRAISVDRRSRSRFSQRSSHTARQKSIARSDRYNISASGAPNSLPDDHPDHVPPVPPLPDLYTNRDNTSDAPGRPSTDYCSAVDSHSVQETEAETEATVDDELPEVSAAEYERILHDELESIWILNLSMHYRDRSKREKFFVTYRESEHVWRRVTVSIDYRDAPANSLEHDLEHTVYQKDKNAKIYDAIRESLPEIKFYPTATNLKLQTTDGRLHVTVVEDGNEIIHYPRVFQVRQLGCRKIRERDIDFDSHISGFVYKVRVDGRVLIKKEIPGPDTVDQFLYEINALHSLRHSNHVIRFYGVVVDDTGEHVKGLLIDHAEHGALVDIIYDECKDAEVENGSIARQDKERWARQIVHGLADIHESGFVQGDFTLSNIVIDDFNEAKIIDINRRGCPVGWEPPEATRLIDAGTPITMYIGVKSDLFQLGMVLWGLAMEEDEPERFPRPLSIDFNKDVPEWYRKITEICLKSDPRQRCQASTLLRMIPMDSNHDHFDEPTDQASISVENDYGFETLGLDRYPEVGVFDTAAGEQDLTTTFTRGRSPTRDFRHLVRQGESEIVIDAAGTWATAENIRPSYTDAGDDPEDGEEDGEEDGNDRIQGPGEGFQYPTPTATPRANNHCLGTSYLLVDDLRARSMSVRGEQAAIGDGGDDDPTLTTAEVSRLAFTGPAAETTSEEQSQGALDASLNTEKRLASQDGIPDDRDASDEDYASYRSEGRTNSSERSSRESRSTDTSTEEPDVDEFDSSVDTDEAATPRQTDVTLQADLITDKLEQERQQGLERVDILEKSSDAHQESAENDLNADAQEQDTHQPELVEAPGNIRAAEAVHEGISDMTNDIGLDQATENAEEIDRVEEVDDQEGAESSHLVERTENRLEEEEAEASKLLSLEDDRKLTVSEDANSVLDQSPIATEDDSGEESRKVITISSHNNDDEAEKAPSEEGLDNVHSMEKQTGNTEHDTQVEQAVAGREEDNEDTGADAEPPPNPAPFASQEQGTHDLKETTPMSEPNCNSNQDHGDGPYHEEDSSSTGSVGTATPVTSTADDEGGASGQVFQTERESEESEAAPEKGSAISPRLDGEPEAMLPVGSEVGTVMEVQA